MPFPACLGRLYGTWSLPSAFSMIRVREKHKKHPGLPIAEDSFSIICNTLWVAERVLTIQWMVKLISRGCGVGDIVESGRLGPCGVVARELYLIWYLSSVPHLTGHVYTLAVQVLYVSLRSGKTLRLRFLLEPSWVLWAKGDTPLFILCQHLRLPETLSAFLRSHHT